jgi:hypothetical protein
MIYSEAMRHTNEKRGLSVGGYRRYTSPLPIPRDLPQAYRLINPALFVPI